MDWSLLNNDRTGNKRILGAIQVHNIFQYSCVLGLAFRSTSKGQLVIINIPTNLCLRMQSVIKKGSSLHSQPKTRPLLIIVVIVVVIEMHVLSSRGRRPRSVVAFSAACRLLLGGDEVYDGCDDSAVFRLTVLPVYRSRVTNFLLQQRIQLSL